MYVVKILKFMNSRPIRLANVRNNQYFTLIDRPLEPIIRLFRNYGTNLITCRSTSGLIELSDDVLCYRYRA